MRRLRNGVIKYLRYLCLVGVTALGLISIIASGGGGGSSRVNSTPEVVFEWDANKEPALAGYRLYKSDTSGVYTFGAGNEVAEIPAGNETVTLSNVPSGTWYWVLTAYNTYGFESDPSNEVEQSQYIAFRR